MADYVLLAICTGYTNDLMGIIGLYETHKQMLLARFELQTNMQIQFT